MRALTLRTYYVGDMRVWEMKYPYFVFALPGRIMGDIEPGIIPSQYKFCYREFNTDCMIYAQWYLVPAIKLYRYWRMNRWNIERILCRHGILWTDSSCYFSTRTLNWNWRWYDKSTWYNHL